MGQGSTVLTGSNNMDNEALVTVASAGRYTNPGGEDGFSAAELASNFVDLPDQYDKDSAYGQASNNAVYKLWLKAHRTANNETLTGDWAASTFTRATTDANYQNQQRQYSTTTKAWRTAVSDDGSKLYQAERATTTVLTGGPALTHFEVKSALQ